jgi:hypothetical protein
MHLNFMLNYPTIRCFTFLMFNCTNNVGKEVVEFRLLFINQFRKYCIFGFYTFFKSIKTDGYINSPQLLYV